MKKSELTEWLTLPSLSNHIVGNIAVGLRGDREIYSGATAGWLWVTDRIRLHAIELTRLNISQAMAVLARHNEPEQKVIEAIRTKYLSSNPNARPFAECLYDAELYAITFGDEKGWEMAYVIDDDDGSIEAVRGYHADTGRIGVLATQHMEAK